MDDLRPNLVGGLLGLQQGLLEDHALAHGNLQHSGQESKFMALQDNRLMGISAHENRLLGLTQDSRSTSAASAGDNKAPVQRKCSSTPEDFNTLYGGIPTSGLTEAPSHHHTPTHTPPNRLSDHSVTGNNKLLTINTSKADDVFSHASRCFFALFILHFHLFILQ
ncbi:homeobox protein abdominal-B [Sergentomyia squamirostris]